MLSSGWASGERSRPLGAGACCPDAWRAPVLRRIPLGSRSSRADACSRALAGSLASGIPKGAYTRTLGWWS
eukprot:13521582-Alexandrium_andersonii.AAC.1